MPELAKMNNPSISDILSELIQHKNLTVSELARRIRVPQPTIQRIVSGLHARPHKKTLIAISEYFEISIDQLIGLQPITWLSDVKNRVRMIPLLTSKQVLNWPKLPQTKLDYISFDIAENQQAFAMRMTDDSMEPVIPKHSILIIDPDKQFSYRSFILIQRKNFQDIMVRQMINDGNICYIRAVGTDFNNISMPLLNETDKILGVVIETRMQLEN